MGKWRTPYYIADTCMQSHINLHLVCINGHGTRLLDNQTNPGSRPEMKREVVAAE
jgi:hypothetical protein